MLLAAGGTGGHVVPAIAVAEALTKQSDIEVIFVGTGRDIERRLIEKAGFKLHALPASPLVGAGLIGLLRLLVRLPGAILAQLALFRSRKPAVVIGFGGYPSFVPLLSAWLARIPRMLHESNAEVGLANRVLSRIANKIVSANAPSEAFASNRIIQLPNPVRSSFYEIPDWKAPVEGKPYVLLILGGSQGAVSLNTAILELVDLFRATGVHVIHQTGQQDYERVKAEYLAKDFQSVEVVSFIDDIANFYSRAHLVISRSGAMAVSEITAAGRAAVYVPLNIARGHQAANAERVVSDGGAWVVEQNGDFVVELRRVISLLLSNAQMLSVASEKARQLFPRQGERPAERIAREAMELAGSSR